MGDDLGTLLLVSTLPLHSKADAIEARLAVVHEVPRETALRFYAVKSGVRTTLTGEEAREILREAMQAKPPEYMDQLELVTEVVALRAENARLRAELALATAPEVARALLENKSTPSAAHGHRQNCRDEACEGCR